MIPRLDISFPFKRQKQFCFGREYRPGEGEYLLDHARSGIVMALRACCPEGGRVGVVVFNCHTVANAVVSAGCTPVFLDVDDELRLELDSVSSRNLPQLDAVVVTNLFGVRNDIPAVRRAFPGAVIIVDNVHGYGLPPEGDFTVFSINQGKYPSLGEGGLLFVNNARYLMDIQRQYEELQGYGFFASLKLFVTMIAKAFMYLPTVYGLLTVRLKAGRSNDAVHSPVVPRRMCAGVSRMYRAWAAEHCGEALAKPFMDVLHTDNPERTIAEYRARGIEVATHFGNSIRWAKEFGYVEGTCPNAERLVHLLVMVPNYYLTKRRLKK